MGSMQKVLVSALVPTYNAERFMRGLLEDLEAQTIADRLEIVIVDTGSPTHEKAIVEEFQKRFENIVYIRTEHRESSHSAINRCIKAARGKYVTLACTDDRHKKDAFERMIDVIEARPDVALVYANCYVTRTENETFENHTRVNVYRWADFDPVRLIFGCYAGPQPMWRKSVHDKYGYFDERLESAGDWDFWLRMAEGETFLHIAEFLGVYLYSPTSSEHRDPGLSRREALLIQQRYLHRLGRLGGIQKKIMAGDPVISGALILVRRGLEPNESLACCAEKLQLSLPTPGEFSVRVVRDCPGTPENELGVKVSPSTPATIASLQRGVDWEARYVVLLSAGVLLDRLCLRKMITLADSNPLIAAVGPTSNEAPLFQRVKADYGNLEDDLQSFINRRATQYSGKWEDVPYLGSSCLLFKSEAVRQMGEVGTGPLLTDTLWDLYYRLKTSGFKLACCQEAYVHHLGHKEDGVIGYDDRVDGERLFNMGDIENAKRVFEKILLIDPDNLQVLNNIGVIAFQQKEIDRAISCFTRVLERDETYFEATENLGKCMVANQKYEEALHWFRRALELKPDDVDILNALANCFIQIEDFTRAEETYSRSCQLDRNQPTVGKILAELERMKAFQRQRRITP
jgi:glycosyltransferase involved in cell wall biosynthesis/tetratricopeptide (TPR) repeat protein